MNVLKFIKEFVLHPTKTGAIAPSSPALASLIVEAARVSESRMIVEFGPGTGVFTEQILEEMPEGADFFAVELNERFATAASERCPEAAIYHDCATKSRHYLASHGQEHCDAIICGLPWASFSDELQDRLLDTILDILHPGGRFVTFAYLQGLLLPAGKAFRQKLRSRFSEVERTRTVWLNLPPAFVYAAVK